VVLGDVLGEARRRQRDGGLGKKFVAAPRCEQRGGMVEGGRALAPLLRRVARDADRVEPARGPQRGAAVEAERAERVGLGEALDGVAREAGDRGELLDAGAAVAAGGDELLDLVLGEALDLAE